MYTKNDFGRELTEEIYKNFDIEIISRWAYEKYLDQARWLDNETYDAIMIVVSMIEGDEFSFTKDELLKFASNLQNK